MLVDDHIFCGSLNVADPYTGPRYGESSFRDLNCYVTNVDTQRVREFFLDILKINQDQLPEKMQGPKLEEMFKKFDAEFADKLKAENELSPK